MRTGTRRFASIGLLAALIAVGCDKVTLSAPSNSTLTLTTAAAANGGTQVVATVLEQAGTPVQNGTTVRFTSTLGRMDPAEAQTNNGVASSTFQPGSDSGEATVTVSSGATTATTKVLAGTAQVDSVSVRASAGSVPATGGTVDITARVVNAAGSALSGVPVTFSTTAGSLSSTREVSDGNGEANTRLTTDSQAVVTATAGTKTSNPGATIQVLNPIVTPTLAFGVPTGQTATSVAQLWSFTVTPSTAPAFGNPVKFIWDFGDGVVVENQSPSITHAFTSELTVFHVKATAVYANGTQATATVDIVTADFP